MCVHTATRSIAHIGRDGVEPQKTSKNPALRLHVAASVVSWAGRRQMLPTAYSLTLCSDIPSVNVGGRDGGYGWCSTGKQEHDNANQMQSIQMHNWSEPCMEEGGPDRRTKLKKVGTELQRGGAKNHQIWDNYWGNDVQNKPQKN